MTELQKLRNKLNDCNSLAHPHCRFLMAELLKQIEELGKRLDEMEEEPAVVDD